MKPRVITTVVEMRAWVADIRRQHKTIACVPTMGALHAGHGALIARARAEADAVVVTIFVNPTQFDRKDDFEKYARNLDEDIAFCEARGVEAVFAPETAEMYPPGVQTYIEVAEIGRYLCGAARPGHFRGVATVVAKLFNIVTPDIACFGEKDAQQLALVEQMVRDLDFPVRVVRVETVREADGLALSSRNARLSAEERRIAPLLYRALQHGKRMLESGERDPAVVKQNIMELLKQAREISVEYLEVVDARTMHPVERVQDEGRIALAAWLGNTRLIDNVPVHPH